MSNYSPSGRAESIRDDQAKSFLTVFGGWASPEEWWQARGIDMEVLDLRGEFEIDASRSSRGVNGDVLEQHFTRMRLQ